MSVKIIPIMALYFSLKSFLLFIRSEIVFI